MAAVSARRRRNNGHDPVDRASRATTRAYKTLLFFFCYYLVLLLPLCDSAASSYQDNKVLPLFVRATNNAHGSGEIGGEDGGGWRWEDDTAGDACGSSEEDACQDIRRCKACVHDSRRKVNSTLLRLEVIPSKQGLVSKGSQPLGCRYCCIFLRSGIVVSSGTFTWSDVANCTLTCCVELQPIILWQKSCTLTRCRTHRSIRSCLAVMAVALFTLGCVPQLRCIRAARNVVSDASFHALGTQHFVSVCNRDCCACCEQRLLVSVSPSWAWPRAGSVLLA